MNLAREEYKKWAENEENDFDDIPRKEAIQSIQSKYYMGWLHSLKIAGLLNNYFPMWPETVIDKYEGYHFDKRGKGKE